MALLRFVHAGFGDRAVPYETAWTYQRWLHSARALGLIPDTVVLLEHEPVFTAGRRTDPADRPQDGSPVVEVDRGGKITWHGPGQLTGYPIVALPEHVYVVDYVRRLESAIIGLCADLGLATGRVHGRSGVWVPAGGAPQGVHGTDPGGTRGPDRKIAAIGVRVARGVTMHGFAVNCDADLSWFDRIVPCGLRDAEVTSLSAELGRRVTVAEILPLAERRLAAVLDADAVEHTDADLVVGAP